MSQRSLRSIQRGQHAARRRWLLFPLLIVALLGGVVLGVNPAWEATRMREAYLPQLIMWSQKDPLDVRLLELLGVRFAQAQDYGRAAKALQQAASVGDTAPECWLTWAAVTAAAGDRQRALAVLKLAEVHHIPGANDAATRLAALSSKATPLQMAAVVVPDGTTSLVNRAGAGSLFNGLVAWWGRRHPASSGFTTRQHWAAQEPRDPEVQRLWGEALLLNQDWPLAEAALNQANQLAPHSLPTLLDLGVVLNKEGYHESAARIYLECLRLSPASSAATLGLAQANLESKLVEPAAVLFGRLTHEHPDLVDAWVGLGQAYSVGSKHLDESIAAFQRAVKLAPDRTDFYVDYAFALRMDYRVDDSEMILLRRIQAAPDDTRALLSLAMLIVRNRPSLEREQQAAGYLQTVLDLEPHNASAETELASIFLHQHKPDGALTLLQDATVTEPYDSNGARLLAQAYGETGHSTEASLARERAESLARYMEQVQVYRNQIELNPTDPQTHARLAQVYAAGGETQKAREEAHLADVLSGRAKAPAPSMLAVIPPTSSSPQKHP